MPLYNDRQLMVVCALLCFLCVAPAAREMRKPDKARPPAPAPAFVCELRGNIDREGFFCFSGTKTIAELAKACGAPALHMTAGAAVSEKIKNGSRVTFTDTVSIDGMRPRARMNFFLPLSVNTSSAEALTLIPGLGAKTARAIVEYRDRHKGISDVEELRAVKGLGGKKLALLRPYLTE